MPPGSSQLKPAQGTVGYIIYLKNSALPTHKLLFFTLGYVTAVTVFKNSFALN
jgi:hypothetical protein